MKNLKKAALIALSALMILALAACGKSGNKAVYRTLDEIRDAYQFDVSCAGSVPQAMEAFLEAESFEDAVRNAISLGGDSDTIACMAGAVAAAFFGIPKDIREAAQPFLEGEVKRVYQAFIQRY